VPDKSGNYIPTQPHGGEGKQRGIPKVPLCKREDLNNPFCKKGGIPDVSSSRNCRSFQILGVGISDVDEKEAKPSSLKESKRFALFDGI